MNKWCQLKFVKDKKVIILNRLNQPLINLLILNTLVHINIEDLFTYTVLLCVVLLFLRPVLRTDHTKMNLI